MGLVRLGPLVADIRGAVGGVVFARGYAGNYVRNRTKPVYPGSPKQNARSSLMSTLVGLWQGTLTPAQRLAWNNRGNQTTLRNRLGDDFSPSGFNLYARSNFLLDLTGQALITTPPSVVVTPAIPATVDYDEGTGARITAINAFSTAPTGRFLMQRTYNMPLSRYFFKGPWDGLTWNNLGVLDALPYLWGPEADISQGTRNWLRLKVVLASGAISAETIYSADRAAA